MSEQLWNRICEINPLAPAESEDLDACLVAIGKECLADAAQPRILAKLEEFNSAPLNVKLKRRLRRTIDLFKGKQPAVAISVVKQKNQDKHASEVLPGSRRSLKEITAQLKLADSIHDVEEVLNHFSVEGDASKTRTPGDLLAFKQQLEIILTKEKLTNKVVRRRLSRVIFVLSSPEEQRVWKEKHKEAAGKRPLQTKTNEKKKAPPTIPSHLSSYTPTRLISPPTEPYVPAVEAKSLLQARNDIAAGTSTEEIDKALTGVSAVSQGDRESRDALKAQLDALLLGPSQDPPPSITLNAKVRRRVKRVLEILQEWKPPPAASPAQAFFEAGVPSSLLPSQPPFPSRPPVQALEPSTKPLQVSSSSSSSAKVVAKSCDLSVVIKKCRAVKSIVDLDEALADVKPDSGTCHTRRSLKRTIENLLTVEEITSGMNAKIRRRIKRVVDGLEYDPELQSRKAAEEKEQSARSKEKKKGKVDLNTSVKGVHPYIVFVGQLSYSTASEDVEKHFRCHGVEGPIKVRLLTEKSGENKGMAFVELEGARELHKALTLHHSVLQGRMINVEKSCGGKDKENRGEKLKMKKNEQRERIKERIDSILLEYQEKHVLKVESVGTEFKEKLYNYSPVIVNEVLKEYAKLSGAANDNSKLYLLDQILTQRYGDTQQFQYQKVDRVEERIQ